MERIVLHRIALSRIESVECVAVQAHLPGLSHERRWFVQGARQKLRNEFQYSGMLRGVYELERRRRDSYAGSS